MANYNSCCGGIKPAKVLFALKGFIPNSQFRDSSPVVQMLKSLETLFAVESHN